MKSKLIAFLVFPFLAASSLTNYNATIQNNNDEKEHSIVKENSNNLEMVEYDNGDDMHTMGNFLNAETHENKTGQYVSILEANIFFALKDGYTFKDFSDLELTSYFTLYDTTNGDFEAIEVKEVDSTKYWIGNVNPGEGVTPVVQWNIYGSIRMQTKLEEFHDYRVGFNLQEGDDMSIYSETVSLAIPELANFSSIPTETTLTINYELVNPSDEVTFDYNEIYLMVDNRKIDLNNQTSDEVLVENLKPAHNYDVAIGFDATKIVTPTNQYNISHEYSLEVSTLMPSDYGIEIVIFSSILLFILLIILLILIVIILYWNYQRRKISGLALVVGEDTEAYDPIYQYNYYQEEQSDNDNNQTPNNQNEEVYGYSDEAQDNNSYQDEEIAGYFDEVYGDESYDIEDYEDGEGVYDIDSNDEGEWY